MSRREAHDASSFYERFPAPEISDDDTIERPPSACLDRLWVGDARNMDACGDVKDNSVALIVTSPPYFAGKEYEQVLGEGHVPDTYISYLEMLEEVFAECVRKLEPGGRIAVNVANLGRRPYRSLSADVIAILQDRLRLLLRGEVIWHKAKGANGNCAWGSFQRPGNPVLRDLTERVVIASKGRFDRAVRASERAERALPSEGSAHVDEFLEATTDIWEIPTESATRIGHPAPFPVELPQRIIELYTYRDDLVLDPFVGAGTTAVAAVRTQRHYAGFDTDASYIDLAARRIADEKRRIDEEQSANTERVVVSVTVPPTAARNGQSRRAVDAVDMASSPQDGSSSSGDETAGAEVDFQARAVREGHKAQAMALAVLKECGFIDVNSKVRPIRGVQPNLEAFDQSGRRWFFDVSGAFSVTQRPGLRRTDTLWKALGKAAVLHADDADSRLVLLTTNRPAPNSSGQQALDTLTGAGKPVWAVIVMCLPETRDELRKLALGESRDAEVGVRAKIAVSGD